MIACWAKWPNLNTHDEFCYWLQADTFRLGRMTNPTHPHWQHFESFHLLVQPTYCAKYPPGYALFMVFGWQLLGSPVAGLWLAAVCASLATHWMLRGLMSHRWALVGSVGMSLESSLHAAWSQSYMTGWPTIVATSLLLGGLFRMRRNWSAQASIAIAMGLVGLANTRPFEGAVVSVGAFALFAIDRLYAIQRWRLAESRLTESNKSEVSGSAYSPIPKARECGRVVLAGLIPLMVGAGLWCSYNQATTGSAWKMAYSLYEKQYGLVPLLLWQNAPETHPIYLHHELRRFNEEYCLGGFTSLRQFPAYVREVFRRLVGWAFLLGLFLAALPLVTAVWWIRFRTMRAMACLLLWMSGCSLMVQWWNWHYSATWIPVTVILATMGLRLWLSRQNKMTATASKPALGTHPSRRWIQAISIVVIAQTLLSSILFSSQASEPAIHHWFLQRQEIAERLDQNVGRHLIFVRYSKEHNLHQEWVYNSADIDGSQVIWARSMSSEMNEQLMAYYPDRIIWEVQPDKFGREENGDETGHQNVMQTKIRDRMKP